MFPVTLLRYVSSWHELSLLRHLQHDVISWLSRVNDYTLFTHPMWPAWHMATLIYAMVCLVYINCLNIITLLRLGPSIQPDKVHFITAGPLGQQWCCKWISYFVYLILFIISDTSYEFIIFIITYTHLLLFIMLC